MVGVGVEADTKKPFLPPMTLKSLDERGWGLNVGGRKCFFQLAIFLLARLERRDWAIDGSVMRVVPVWTADWRMNWPSVASPF